MFRRRLLVVLTCTSVLMSVLSTLGYVTSLLYGTHFSSVTPAGWHTFNYGAGGCNWEHRTTNQYLPPVNGTDSEGGIPRLAWIPVVLRHTLCLPTGAYGPMVLSSHRISASICQHAFLPSRHRCGTNPDDICDLHADTPILSWEARALFELRLRPHRQRIAHVPRMRHADKEAEPLAGRNGIVRPGSQIEYDVYLPQFSDSSTHN